MIYPLNTEHWKKVLSVIIPLLLQTLYADVRVSQVKADVAIIQTSLFPLFPTNPSSCHWVTTGSFYPPTYQTNEELPILSLSVFKIYWGNFFVATRISLTIWHRDEIVIHDNVKKKYIVYSIPWRFRCHTICLDNVVILKLSFESHTHKYLFVMAVFVLI